VEALIGWFDLNGTTYTLMAASDDGVSVGYQLLLYAVVVAGVLLSQSVAMARQAQAITLDLSWPWVATACLIALVVFPAVWRDIGSMPEAGTFAQLGLAAQGGVFWGVLVAGAEKGTRARAAAGADG